MLEIETVDQENNTFKEKYEKAFLERKAAGNEVDNMREKFTSPMVTTEEKLTEIKEKRE